jgi:hypothetical protein
MSAMSAMILASASKIVTSFPPLSIRDHSGSTAIGDQSAIPAHAQQKVLNVEDKPMVVI